MRNIETLVVLESLDGALLSDTLVCLDTGQRLYLPVIDTALALGVSIEEVSPGVFRVERGSSFIDLTFPECQSTEVRDCPRLMSRGDVPYIGLQEAREQLKWLLQYDARRLALVIESSGIKNSQQNRSVEVSTSTEPEINRDVFSKPQVSLQVSYKSESQTSSLALGSVSSFLGEDLWLQHSSNQESPLGRYESETAVTLSRRSSKANLLGPLSARQYEALSIRSPDLSYITRSQTVWGLQFSSYDETGSSGVFSRRTLRGRGLPNWKVELFLNDVFLSETFIGSNYEYEFIDIPVYFGVNNYLLILTGPLGQREVREEVFQVNSEKLRPGEFGYRVNTGSLSGFRANYFEAGYGLTDRISSQLAVIHLEDSSSNFHDVFWQPRLSYLGQGYSFQLANIISKKRGSASTLSPQIQWGSSLLNADFTIFRDFQSPLVNLSIGDIQKSEVRLSSLTPFKWGDSENPSSAQFRYSQKGFQKDTGEFKEEVVGVRLLSRVGGLTYAFERNEVLQTKAFDSSIDILSSEPVSIKRLTLSFASELRPKILAAWEQQANDRNRIAVSVNHSLSEVPQTEWSFRWAKDWKTWASELKIDIGQEIFFGVSASSAWLNHPVDDSYRPSSRGDIASSGVRFVVFIDGNENGALDSTEERVSQVRLRSSQSHEEYSSDENGIIPISGLAPYLEQSFDVLVESIPNLYLTPSQNKFVFMLTPAQTLQILIPLKSRFDVKGIIRFRDRKKLIPLILRKNNGDIFASTLTNRNGEFRFNDVPAGQYTLEIENKFLLSFPGQFLNQQISLSGPGGVKYLETISLESQVQERQ